MPLFIYVWNRTDFYVQKVSRFGVCFEHTRYSVNYFRQFWPNIVVGDGESELISSTHYSKDLSNEHILHNLCSHVCRECMRKEHSSFLWQFGRTENWRKYKWNERIVSTRARQSIFVWNVIVVGDGVVDVHFISSEESEVREIRD